MVLVTTATPCSVCCVMHWRSSSKNCRKKYFQYYGNNILYIGLALCTHLSQDETRLTPVCVPVCCAVQCCSAVLVEYVQPVLRQSAVPRGGLVRAGGILAQRHPQHQHTHLRGGARLHRRLAEPPRLHQAAVRMGCRSGRLVKQNLIKQTCQLKLQSHLSN